MSLSQLATLFNRSISHIWGIKKLLCLFLTLLLSGVVFLIFQIIAIYSSDWLQLSLQGIPFFIMVSFLLACGTLLIKTYAQERLKPSGVFNEEYSEERSMKEEFMGAWEIVLRASYFALPLLIAFLLIWVMLGVFILLISIPYLGEFLGVILAFAPFLLHLAALLLFLLAAAILFFITPKLALSEKLELKSVASSLKEDVFTNLLLFALALLPIWICWLFLSKAAHLTFGIYTLEEKPFEIILQSFFILIPFAALMTPAVAFFFNFSLEAHLRKG